MSHATAELTLEALARMLADPDRPPSHRIAAALERITETLAELSQPSREQERDEQARKAYQREMNDLRIGARIMRAGSDDYDRARELILEHCGEPLDVSVSRTLEVLLTTGGPAAGYEFDLVDDTDEIEGGRYWYQDWFTGKRYFHLNNDEVRDAIATYDLEAHGYYY